MKTQRQLVPELLISCLAVISLVYCFSFSITRPLQGEEVARLNGSIGFWDLLAAIDGKHFFTSDSHQNVILWNLEDRKALKKIKIGENESPYALSMTQEPRKILVATRTTADFSEIYRMDFERDSFDKLRTVKGSARCFFKDLVVAGVPRGRPTTLICYDIAKGQTMMVDSPGKRIRQAAFSPDGACLVAVSDTWVLTAWDYPSGKQRWRRQARDYTEKFFFIANGSKLLSVNIPFSAIRDMRTGEIVAEQFHLMPRAVHPDGKHVVEKDKDDWVFKSIAPVKEIARFNFDPGRWDCKFLAFTPDGKTMIGAGSYGHIRIWKTPPLGE